MNLGVSLNDYQSGALDNQVLFDTASTTQEQLGELNKALEAQQITGRDTTDSTTASGAPLKVESLEKTLKLITFKESDIRFWKRIPKTPAFNTVEEYNQLQSYGADRGGFTNEGELPEEEDSIYVRKAELVKFLGVTKSVTHPMQLVNTHIGDIIQRETQNGIMWLLRKADKALFHADSNVIPQEFNGYYVQHYRNGGYANLESYYVNNEVVIDLRGKSLREDNIQQGCEAIIRNFGYADMLIAPPIVLTDFVTKFHESKFIQPGQGGTINGVMGQSVQKFQSQYGQIDLEYDIFAAKPGPRKTTDPAISTKAPANIVPDGTTPLNAVTDASSKFAAADAGDYFYAVAPVNRYGEGSLVALSSAAVTVAAGESVDVKFGDGGGAYPATGYVIYRSVKNPSGTAANATYYPLFTVSKAELTAGYDGGDAANVRDRNRILTNCQEAMLLQSNNEVIDFKQLAPIMKMDLATLSPSKRWMILMYGTPVLYATKKIVRFVNIGRDLS